MVMSKQAWDFHITVLLPTNTAILIGQKVKVILENGEVFIGKLAGGEVDLTEIEEVDLGSVTGFLSACGQDMVGFPGFRFRDKPSEFEEPWNWSDAQGCGDK